MKTLDLQTTEQWRDWLAKHHSSETEVWLIFHKRHTERASIPYEHAVDQALCFGWIDSLIKRLDDSHYARKFTPRKPDSRWSEINRKRYLRLRASGQLTPAGLSREPTKTYDPPRSLPKVTPSYIRKALKKSPAAWATFEKLTPLQRRLYIGWIDLAKQQQTRARRLQEATRLLAAGKKLGLK